VWKSSSTLKKSLETLKKRVATSRKSLATLRKRVATVRKRVATVKKRVATVAQSGTRRLYPLPRQGRGGVSITNAEFVDLRCYDQSWWAR